jgi:hypothetical protein
METWYRRRYNLPPTDPRFLDSTVEDIELDYWTQHFADRPNAVEDEDDDFDIDEIKAQMAANPDDWEDALTHDAGPS